MALVPGKDTEAIAVLKEGVQYSGRVVLRSGRVGLGCCTTRVWSTEVGEGGTEVGEGGTESGWY
eukprot:3482451-Rhodomonas_salina.1